MKTNIQAQAGSRSSWGCDVMASCAKYLGDRVEERGRNEKGASREVTAKRMRYWAKKGRLPAACQAVEVRVYSIGKDNSAELTPFHQACQFCLVLFHQNQSIVTEYIPKQNYTTPWAPLLHDLTIPHSCFNSAPDPEQTQALPLNSSQQTHILFPLY